MNNKSLNVFPWSSEGPPCLLLLDPKIWIATLCTSARRHAFKKAARKCGWKGVIRSDDEERLGEIFLWFLEKPARRKMLNSILFKEINQSIHNILWMTIYNDDENLKDTWPLKAFCKMDLQERCFLDLDRFKNHLLKIKPIGEELRTILIVSCAFAMLQPKDAEGILNILLDYDPKLESQLVQTGVELEAHAEPHHSTPHESLDSAVENPPAAADTLTHSDEIETSDESSSPEGKSPKAFEITRTWLQEGKVRTDSFFTAQKAAVIAITALGDNLVHFPLDDQKASANVAASLDNLVNAAGRVDSWIDEWFSSLQELLIATKLSLPPEIAALHSLAKQQRSNVGEMEAVCKCLLDTLSQLSKFDVDLKTQLQSILGRIQSVQKDMQLDEIYKPTGPFPPDDLIAGLVVQADLRTTEKETRKKRDDLLALRKQALVETVTQLRTKLPKESGDLPTRLGGLETSLQSVATLLDLDPYSRRTEELQKEIESIRPGLSLQELAAQAMEDGANVGTILLVARAMATQGRPDEAVTLLLLLQHRHEIEALDEIDLNGFVSEYLTLCSGLSANPELKNVWPWIFFSSPWIRTINSGDIHEEMLKRRLAAAFLALHCTSDSSGLLGSFFALDLNVTKFSGEADILNSLMQKTANQEVVFIVSELPEKASIQLGQEIDSFFRTNNRGDYLRQAAHGNMVAEMERETLFPRLQTLWHKIQDACRFGEFSVVRDEIQSAKDIVGEAFKIHSLSATESPYYKKGIFSPQHGYLPDFERLVSRYVDSCEEERQVGSEADSCFQIRKVVTALKIAGSQDANYKSFWLATEESLEGCVDKPFVDTQSASCSLGMLLDHAPGAICITPDLVISLCRSGPIFSPDAGTLEVVLRDLSETRRESLPAFLFDNGCPRHAQLVSNSLIRDGGTIPEAGWKERLQNEIAMAETNFLRRIHAFNGADPKMISTIEAEIKVGHFIWVESEMSRLERTITDMDDDRRKEFGRKFDDLKCAVERIEADILGCAASPVWVESALERASRLRTAIQLKRRDAQVNDIADCDLAQIGSCVAALEFAVGEKALSFNEFDTLMTSGFTTIAPIDRPNEPVKADHSRQLPQELTQAWERLTRINQPTANNVRDDWGRLAKEFSRICGLYHDLKTSLKTAPVRNFLYSYETSFVDPRSRCLDRKISLFLVLKSAEWDLIHLKVHIENSGDSINIVFAPTEANEVRRRLAQGNGDDACVIVDGVRLASLYDPSSSGDPLRQLLHRQTKPLTRIGLFKCEGYVHRQKNLFVGRDDAIRQLTQQPASAIWGGRRIGKTSLLHALSDRLASYHGFKVAIVYADYNDGDPDLGVAQTIAETLGLPRPKDVNALKSLLIEFAKENPVAILIDEMDGYIEASRAYHGPTKFPLARVLRGVVQSDAERRFKIVYAGFKQLFYEVKVRPNSDASDPFKNFLEPVTKDFGDLTSDQVEKFLKMAFTQMLGIGLDPSVPRLVKEKTSGHPAFVQAIGDRILSLISARIQPEQVVEITKKDVEMVYLEDSSAMGDHSSYIDYVNETLGWNLSHLGRAIMLALSIDIKQNGKLNDTAYSKKEIVRILREWSDLAPDETAKNLDMTLDFLVMTNMLHSTNKNGVSSYSIAYLFYIDILSRLGDLNKFDIPDSLKVYHELESNKII